MVNLYPIPITTIPLIRPTGEKQGTGETGDRPQFIPLTTIEIK